jgi:hypothetical protein
MAKTKKVSVPKGRQPKNMGSKGPKATGPKYGRKGGAKAY